MATVVGRLRELSTAPTRELCTTVAEVKGAAPPPLVAAAPQLQAAYDPTFNLTNNPAQVEGAFTAFAQAENGRAPRSHHAWEVPQEPEPLDREILDVRSRRALSYWTGSTRWRSSRRRARIS